VHAQRIGGECESSSAHGIEGYTLSMQERAHLKLTDSKIKSYA
jgi:hypothetical protein